MSLFTRMLRREATEGTVGVAVTGAGLIGRAMVRQVDLTPGMRTNVIVNRTPARAVESFRQAGRTDAEIVVTDDSTEAQQAIDAGRAVVTTRVDLFASLDGVDIVVEVTGAVEYGARVAINAIEGGKHVVMMNAETDATVGCALKRRAETAGVIYTNSDGDQPGVLMRLVDYVGGLGFDVVAAINCKGFMDVNATPDTIRPWAEKQNTSLAMTTAFTDGTKMNIENAVLANATGLVPEVRGMHGVKTDLEHALDDCLAAFSGRRLVDYTVGGNFGGGVFVIGFCEEPLQVRPLMSYLKMGDGPCYLFFRPYHLCHFETPLTIAEAILDHEATISPLDRPRVEVVAIAKKDLEAGDTLDGIGGYAVYGEIDTADNASGLLPIGMTGDVQVVRPVPAGEAIPMDAVAIDHDSLLMQLRAEQEHDHSPIAST